MPRSPHPSSRATILTERLQGSLLFDPDEKREIAASLKTMGKVQLDVLTSAFDREDELLDEALKHDGPRITALLEGYVQRLNAQAYEARRELLTKRETALRKSEQSDADRILEEIPT